MAPPSGPFRGFAHPVVGFRAAEYGRYGLSQFHTRFDLLEYHSKPPVIRETASVLGTPMMLLP